MSNALVKKCAVQLAGRTIAHGAGHSRLEMGSLKGLFIVAGDRL